MNDDVSIGRIHIVLELNIDQYAPIIIESKKKKWLYMICVYDGTICSMEIVTRIQFITSSQTI